MYKRQESSNGPVPAGEWHTLEIPMEQFTDVDPSTVTGFIVTSVHYIEELDADGNQVLLDSGEPSILEVPSRETIYMDEVYFSTVPDAPRSVIGEAPGYADADVVAVYSDEYTTGSVNMGGPDTLGTYSVADIGGDSVAQYTDVRCLLYTSPSPRD